MSNNTYKDVFAGIDADQWGKRYSTAEKNAIAKRWFRSNGSKVPSSDEATSFMETSLKRTEPKNKRRTSGGKKSSSSSRIAKDQDADTFLLADPLVSYSPGQSKKDSDESSLTKLGEGTIGSKYDRKSSIESYKPKPSGKATDTFKDAAVAFIKEHPSYARTKGLPDTTYVFIPAESQLRLDESNGMDITSKEYLEAHVGRLLPRENKGKQDVQTYNKREFSLRRRQDRTELLDPRPFYGKYTFVEKIDNVKGLSAKEKEYVKFCYLGEGEGSLLY